MIKRILTFVVGLAIGVLVFISCSLFRVDGLEVRLGWVALVLYALSFVDYLVAFLKRRRGRSWPGDVLLGIALAAHVAAVIVRGGVAGHLPFASRFEALLFYGLVTAALTYLVNFLRKDLPVAFLGLPIVVIFLLGSLIGGDKAPQPLMPVLNSPFFGIHVIAAFVGYAFYTLNLGLAVGGLFAGSGSQSPGAAGESKPSRLGSPEALYGLARQLVPPGLLFLGAGIGLGAIWAMYSWGNWWGWDPKENAALVTWLGYVVYLHSPGRKRAPGKHDALILIAAYVLLIATFLGVNLLRRGLHTYQ